MESNNKRLTRQRYYPRKKARALLTCAVLTALLSSVAATGKAQTWNEFFRQKKTQKKYLLQQIAALQVYIGYVKKGYEIADQGISTVRSIRDGELGLHDAFFSSLKAVSPVVRNNTKVAEIISMQLSVSSSFNEVKNSDYLSGENLAYISEVAEVVLKECASDLDELLLVITPGKTGMRDDERLKRLEKVYDAMKDKSAFVQSFSSGIHLLASQRKSEQESLTQIRQLYENE